MILTLLLACSTLDDTAAEESAAPDALDLRLAEGDYTGGDVEFRGPDVVIEPGEDIMYCLAGTWSGDDLGIHALTTWQAKFGHHLQFYGLAATTVDYADGAIFPCGVGTDFDMSDTIPVGIPTQVYLDGEETINNPLQEGMAFSFDGGARYLLQAHYVNTGADRIRVMDAVTFDTLDPDTEVTTWAAPAIMNNGNVALPPASSASLSFDCTIDAPMNLLFANGHMHEWGTSFALTRLRGDEATVLNEVPAWESWFRDSPPTTYFGDGVMSLEVGDVVRTDCAWMNSTDESIVFPHEMCDGVALAYPRKTTWLCDSDTGMTE